MIWNPSCESMSRDELVARQSRRLCDLVTRVYHQVPFYRQKMQAVGLVPEDIRGVEDLSKLPFTEKEDLRENYPFGLFAVPLEQIVRVHASSGTTGRATVVGYTRHDIGIWSEVVARALVSAGATPKDVVQVAYGYGLFTGGLGIHYGAERIGATVIPVSGGNTKRQIQLMRDLKSTVLTCTPSYALYLGETMAEMKIARSELHLRIGILGAEPWSEPMRQQIEERLGIRAVDIYGLSEVIGPGVSAECEARAGLHIAEDHFLPEVVEPKTLTPLGPKSEGELVFTTLTKEGMPLLRYRTRDLTELDVAPCSCGRSMCRMRKCLGRSDDMLIIRGVNVFPSQIECALLEVAEVAPHYLIVVEREHNLDNLTLLVEVDERVFGSTMGELEAFTRKVKTAVENGIGLSITVKLVEPKTIERSEGKAKRVLDKRKLV